MPEPLRTQRHLPRTLLLLSLLSWAAPSPMASLASCPLKLPSSNTAQGDGFGSSVSISGDAAMVGMPSYYSSASGAVATYSRSSTGEWNETGQLTSPDEVGNDYFGYAVCVDGDTALVGAYGSDFNGAFSGSVYVFQSQPDGSWHETAMLLPSDGAENNRFGKSVSLWENRALVGSNGNDDDGSVGGTAYLFERQADGTWLQTAKLIASDGELYDAFGNSLDISGDTALVGALGDDDNGSFSGSAYIFRKQDDGSWLQADKLTASDGEPYDQFAFSVSLSGETALVGACYTDQPGLSRVGSAYVFQQDANGNWPQVDKLTASNAQADDCFGRSVSLDGDYAIVAAPSIMDSNCAPGSVYTFQRHSGNDWLETTIITPADGEVEDGFGSSVCVAGNDLIVGMPGDDDYGSSSGSAYLTSISSDSIDQDCNNNGVCDHLDIDSGESQDTNNNGIPDECECPADTNGDGTVDITDVLAVIDAWGDCPPDDDCHADVDFDGTVGVNDMLLIISEWGACV